MADADAYAADGIVVLTGLDPVRRRPGMYIGDVADGSGLHHLLWEVAGNSLDEHLAGHASRIRISIEDGIAEVEDDGRGIPVEVLERVLTTLHSGPTFDDHVPHVHITRTGLGLGLAIVNALCRELEVEVRRAGFRWHQRFARGVALGPLERGDRTRKTGTRICFRPDPEIFASTRFDRAATRERLRELAIWNPELELSLMAERIHEPGGTARWIELMAAELGVDGVFDVFVTRAIRNDVFVEVACAWSSSPYRELRSFVGQSETPEGGSHERGFWRGLAAALAVGAPGKLPRMSRLRRLLAPGLLAVVHVGLRDPRFAGPTRARLSCPVAADAVRDQVAEAFAAHLAAHPDLARMLRARVGGLPSTDR